MFACRLVRQPSTYLCRSLLFLLLLLLITATNLLVYRLSFLVPLDDLGWFYPLRWISVNWPSEECTALVKSSLILLALILTVHNDLSLDRVKCTRITITHPGALTGHTPLLSLTRINHSDTRMFLRKWLFSTRH